MERLIRQIRVRNERGDERTVFELQEFQEFRTVQGTRNRAGRKRFMLDTGEAVKQVDHAHFLLPSTGEALSRE